MGSGNGRRFPCRHRRAYWPQPSKGETYVTTFTYAGINLAERYLVLRIPHSASPSHYRLLFTHVDGSEHALDGSSFQHLYSQAPYKYYGRRYNNNAEGDVVTIQVKSFIKETTAYLGNVESAYPVPDLELLTDDLQARSAPATWSAGATHVDIGIFQAEPDIAALESGSYTAQIDYAAGTTENFSVIRVAALAVPQEVNAYRVVFTDTVDNGVEYIRGAYYRHLHSGLLHEYYGRADSHLSTASVLRWKALRSTTARRAIKARR